ncbi:hypothetical protein ACWD3Z_42220 [Streptomyces sp. NPDC002740]
MPSPLPAVVPLAAPSPATGLLTAPPTQTAADDITGLAGECL